ncbi:MAG: nucleotidyltransferase family protein [Butyrivibrio sp.]|nr:nucleotidyltransferase family protein [Ruminococcus flavefaciens]MCM1559165.1 nucleotidyltransferase family protein [Butyrivibrio sp.]
MDNIRNVCADESISIADGMKQLDQNGERVLFILKDKKLVGAVTDGDFRRWILKNGDFSASITEIMNRSPKYVREDEREKAAELLSRFRIEAVAVVNEKLEIVDVIFLRGVLGEEQPHYDTIDLPVVIMAGGRGTRLYPYTQVLPKPLIPIGSTTILERIIDSFKKNGCNDFFLILNYKKNLIKAYFDEQDMDYNIHYVEERDYYGTCGSLSMLRGKFSTPFFISNCDVLLDIDYAKLYRFHLSNKNEITAVTSLKNIQIPYGVFELEEGQVKKIVEKPELNYNINTGIYIMEPGVLADIPVEHVFQMTDLIEKLLHEGRKVGAYPVMDRRWRDMGQLPEMRQMIDEYESE